MNTAHSKQRSARWLIFAIAAFLLCASVVLWRHTPLGEWASPERVAEWMTRARGSAWAPLVVIAAFVVGGLIMFPLTLLIAATAVVFDPWMAVALSVSGALANALLLYFIGRSLMRETMNRAFGSYIDKLRRALDHSGIVAVATIRMVPIAPFTLVNLAAGAIDVRFRDYALGTLLGVLPGTIVLTAFGRQMRAIIEKPTLANVALLIGVLVVWIALSLGLQRLSSRNRAKRG